MAEVPKLLLSIHSSAGGIEESSNKGIRRPKNSNNAEIQSKNKSKQNAQREDDRNKAGIEETSIGRFRRPTIFSGIRPESPVGAFFSTRQTQDSSGLDVEIEKERQKNQIQRPSKPLPYSQTHVFETRNLILRSLRAEDILEYQLTNFIPEDAPFAAILSPQGSKQEIFKSIQEAIRLRRIELMVIIKLTPRVNNYVPSLSVAGGVLIGLIKIYWPEKDNKGSRIEGFIRVPKELTAIGHQVDAFTAVFEYVLGVLGRKAIYMKFKKQDGDWRCLMKSLGLEALEIICQDTEGEMMTYELGWEEWQKAKDNVTQVPVRTDRLDSGVSLDLDLELNFDAAFGCPSEDTSPLS